MTDPKITIVQCADCGTDLKLHPDDAAAEGTKRCIPCGFVQFKGRAIRGASR